MVLDSQREKVDPLLGFIAGFFSKLNPDVITWFSFFFAVIAALFFFFSSPQTELSTYYLFAAGFFVFLNGFFDALDGKIAKIRRETSVKGDFLDHTLDRYSDIFIVGGLSLSSWCANWIGILAVTGVLLTSYMGTQSQAVGYKRDYSGFLGRADRLTILMITPFLQHVLLRTNLSKITGFYLLEWVLIFFSIMGNLTAIQRFYNTMKWLKKKKT